MSSAICFSEVRVVDAGGPHDGQTVNVLVDADGVLDVVAAVPAECRLVSAPDLHVSPGWVDIGSGVGEPGFEQRETIRSLQAAAAAGGYTRVVAQPITEPPIDDASGVRALRARAAGHPVDVSAIGALSRGGSGEQLAEFGDLVEAGCSFVGDGLRGVGDPKLLQLALAYTQPLDLTVCAQPDAERLAAGGQLHEGPTSTLLGLRGRPAVAETIGLERDLQLLGYRGGRLLVYAPSLASSVERILEARASGADVAFGASALHLLYTDEVAIGYPRGVKMLPPLRGSSDRERLRRAVREGDADALLSLHRPLTIEETDVEFAYAPFGVATLEHVYGIATEAIGDGVVVADYLSRRNRALAGVPAAHIRAGERAELTLFSPKAVYNPTERANRASLAANPAALGEKLTGRAVGVCIGSEYLPRDQ